MKGHLMKVIKRRPMKGHPMKGRLMKGCPMKGEEREVTLAERTLR
jgi:hypothetical protein